MKPKSIFLFGFFLALTGLLYQLFYPRKYDVLAFEKREDTQYWE